MIYLDTEQQLAALVAQMIGGSRKKGPASAAELDELCAAIRDGDDPLGVDWALRRRATRECRASRA